MNEEGEFETNIVRLEILNTNEETIELQMGGTAKDSFHLERDNNN